MKTSELISLELAGQAKVKEIKKSEDSSLLDYGWFQGVLEESFKHDSKAGGAWLCSVVDLAKEDFPYSQRDGKSYNPLKNVVRGLSLKFNAVYSESIGSKFRLATHKSNPTKMVPVSAGTKTTKLERTLNALGEWLDADQVAKIELTIIATLEVKELRESLRATQLVRARKATEIKAALTKRSDVMILAKKSGLITRGTSKADMATLKAMMIAVG